MKEEMKEELYATYEEYQSIIKISEQLNDENEQLMDENIKLKQDKQDYIKWLKTEYVCFDNESDECRIAKEFLSKLGE